ncbi:Hypothetical protein, putative [Bodo saltans]|uniref:WD40 repeat-containing protein n=1 Tax=Bodo saltans TaxID=75058 RepID=A0A0S4IWR1_BODSA|nr:Hypothetical protein, putative [Bodo saltans]|eukprot:CUF81756.1 Hypothetical protein, putative [Bodo saltans]
MVEEAASFHLTTMESERLIVAAFDEKIVLSRLAVQNGTVELLRTWSASQRVRSVVLFQHQSSKKILLAAAGDGKQVHCYDVSNFALNATTTAAPAVSETGAPNLVFTYGLHQKKISHVCAADDDIVLADKFGEVYRLQLAYDESTSTFSATIAEANLLDGGDDDDDDDDKTSNKTPVVVATSGNGAPMFGKQSASFMLQHFSLLTQLYMTDCVPRRLLSCDREGHARVSKYPHTFVIDQFLWNDAPQAPITCIAELSDTQCEGNVIVTGDGKGRVTFWCDAVKVVSASLSEESITSPKKSDGTFKRLTVIDLSAFHAESLAHQSSSSGDDSSAATGATGAASTTARAPATAGVVGLALLHNKAADAFGVLMALDKVDDLFFCPKKKKTARAPAATGVVGLALLHNKAADAFGVLMALDKVDDLFFCPIRDGGFSIEVCSSSITRVPVSRPVVGLVTAGPASALAVLRRGAESTEHSIVVLESDGCEDSSRVRVVDVANSMLAAELNTLGLETLDLFAYWRPTAAKDPRAAKLQQDDDEAEDNEGEAAKKRNRTQ